MRSKIVCALVIAGLTVGCDSGRSQAEEIVLAKLKDPSSAEFGDYEEVLAKKRDWACLGVNSRNSFGGYTGEESARFVRKAAASDWEFQGIAPQSFDECVKMITSMQPYEGGPR